MIYKIRLDALEFFGYHGVQQHEKDFGQTFLVDCHLDVEAGSEDSIDSTVSYALVADELEKVATKQRFDLIETLAQRCLAAVLDLDARILRVTITIHKPNAPLTQSFGDVSVSVSGARGD